MTLKHITHVFITHIHLDHAGAAGWLAREGAQVYVHPLGVSHLINPEKLLTSATRIYGDQIEALWGQFLPVPASNLNEVQDGQEIIVGGHQIIAHHTPGHADHHVTYQFEDVGFTGDIGGVRLPGTSYVRLPFVPPELHMDKWRRSLENLSGLKLKYIAPTHFGVFDDVVSHLNNARQTIDETEHWLESEMIESPAIEVLRERYTAWLHCQSSDLGIDSDLLKVYELAIPTWLSADGLHRYWRKFRVDS